jgi:hypothetical protein
MTDYVSIPMKNGGKQWSFPAEFLPFYSRFRPYTPPFPTVEMNVLAMSISKAREAFIKLLMETKFEV